MHSFDFSNKFYCRTVSLIYFVYLLRFLNNIVMFVQYLKKTLLFQMNPT